VNLNGKARFGEYIDMLNTNENDFGILSFQTGYLEKQFTKRAVFDHFESNESIKNAYHNIATVLIMKKNTHSVPIVDKWYSAATHNLINDDIQDEDPIFYGHRHDQSILSVLVNTHGSIKLQDETFFFNWVDGQNYPFLSKRGYV
jgi:hypothetical protein